jgi:hypothetical protein
VTEIEEIREELARTIYSRTHRMEGARVMADILMESSAGGWKELESSTGDERENRMANLGILIEDIQTRESTFPEPSVPPVRPPVEPKSSARVIGPRVES